MISLIIPVFNESQYLPDLLEKISEMPLNSDLELIVVDDSYDDLTVKSIESYKAKMKLKIIHRKKRLGLSSAVIEGFDAASSNILICMDGDGSHPPEIIEALAKEIESGNKMVLASRNIPGGGAAEEWSLLRRFISKACTLLVAPLSSLKDPMSGFFGVSGEFYKNVRPHLKPVSYKIALEIAVKGRLKNISEVPFRFEERKAGSSKVNLSVIVGMAYHFFSLYCWRIFARKV